MQSNTVALAESSGTDLRQVLQAVIDNYPSIETALLQIQRARLSAAKSQSLLGWQLQGQAGVARDVSLFGSGVDVISANARLNRRLESGGTIGIDAGINRQDSEDSFPTVPNPATSTSLDLSYRHPLEKGADNPGYAESALQARLDESLALAQRTLLYDQLAEQIIELYIGTVGTQSRQNNIQQAIKRSLRRQKYLKSRTDLGVAEEKDLLQVDAQLKAQRAELRAIDVVWQAQRIRLNRLMGRDAASKLTLISSERLQATDKPSTGDAKTIELQAIKHNAELVAIDSRLQLADSAIRLRRDDRQDLLDLVLFVGNRTQNGDIATGSSSESEIVGGVRLEFQQQYDKHAVDAELDQALLDKDIALVDKKQLLQDIHYDVAALIAQVDYGNSAFRAYQRSVKSERAKLQEAEQRYRTGRTDTDQLLTFETQLAAAELATELQKIDLLKNDYALQLLTGTLWQGLRLPEQEPEL